MGKKADAIRYAETSRGFNDSPIAIARACEGVLLSSGLADEAYERYAIEANQSTSHLATYRAITKKYPHKKPADISLPNPRYQTQPGPSNTRWVRAQTRKSSLQPAVLQ